MERNGATSLQEEFHQLEKQCVGFENYVNADDEHYSKALEGLKSVIEQIKSDNIK